MVFFISLYKIIPIFIIIFTGFIMGKIFYKKDSELLGKLVLFIFGTTLSFTYVNTHPPSGKDFSIYIFTYFIIFSLFVLIITFFYKIKFYKFDPGFSIVSVMFINAGYLGYPIISQLYGEKYVAYAVIFSISMTLITSTIGIIFLTGNLKKGFINIFKIPLIYAFLLGWILGLNNISYIDFPKVFSVPIHMIREAAIPIILIFIGINLSKVNFKINELKYPLLITFLKLMILPFISYIVIQFIPMDFMLKRIFLIETAMPTAMNVVIITSYLNKNPEKASLVVFMTTLLSMFTIPLWSLIF